MVRQYRRLAALPANERWLLLRVAVVIASTRIALWVLPFRWVCARVQGRQANSRQLEAVPVNRLMWAVRLVARRIPLASCLTQALALQWLLVRAGHSAQLHIGVAKNDAHIFEAHAWVEYLGEVLLGSDEDLNRFAPILALPVEKP